MLTAIINQEACVKCAVCIDVCPFDAITGSVGQKHVVLTDVCIGCKLCVNPCPVDCIEIAPLKTDKLIDRKQMIIKAKERRAIKAVRIKSQKIAKFSTKEVIQRDLKEILKTKV
ncbi:MAG: RnfABCDGE type electron transport complex subunit B [Gammaproteobacteria bacterium]|jgi:RnfABCDGE-type electron transport complex B subunit